MSLSLSLSLSLQKGTLAPIPSESLLLLLISCQATHLPAMCNSVWDFRGNLTYIPTRKWIKRCHFAVSFRLTLKHKQESKRGASSCLVFSYNPPGWTPCWGGNLHFDWCTLEVSAWLFQSRCTGKQPRIAIKACISRTICSTVQWNSG